MGDWPHKTAGPLCLLFFRVIPRQLGCLGDGNCQILMGKGLERWRIGTVEYGTVILFLSGRVPLFLADLWWHSGFIPRWQSDFAAPSWLFWWNWRIFDAQFCAG